MLNAHPRKVWTQAKGRYPALADQLLKVYCAPASTAGVERNHKVMHRVKCKARSRLGDTKVERQVAARLNSCVGDIDTATCRQQFELQRISNPFDTAVRLLETHPATSQPTEEIDDGPLLHDFTDMELLEQD
jgi:dynactin complex subunit